MPRYEYNYNSVRFIELHMEVGGMIVKNKNKSSTVGKPLLYIAQANLELAAPKMKRVLLTNFENEDPKEQSNRNENIVSCAVEEMIKEEQLEEQQVENKIEEEQLEEQQVENKMEEEQLEGQQVENKIEEEQPEEQQEENKMEEEQTEEQVKTVPHNR